MTDFFCWLGLTHCAEQAARAVDHGAPEISGAAQLVLVVVLVLGGVAMLSDRGRG